MRIYITLPQLKGDAIDIAAIDLELFLGPMASVEVLNQPDAYDIEVITKNPLVKRKIRQFFKQHKIPYIIDLNENLKRFKTFLEAKDNIIDFKQKRKEFHQKKFIAKISSAMSGFADHYEYERIAKEEMYEIMKIIKSRDSNLKIPGLKYNSLTNPNLWKDELRRDMIHAIQEFMYESNLVRIHSPKYSRENYLYEIERGIEGYTESNVIKLDILHKSVDKIIKHINQDLKIVNNFKKKWQKKKDEGLFHTYLDAPNIITSKYYGYPDIISDLEKFKRQWK